MTQPLVQLRPDHLQVVSWPGTVITPEQVPEFEKWMLEEFECRVQYLESVTTNHSRDESGFRQLLGTGGREDLLFAVHIEDTNVMAHVRLMIGAKWLDDLYLAGHGYLYPQRVFGYCCWPQIVGKKQ